MKDESKTREKLIESAKKQFLEHGYMKASLRKICADAGVTTGALYFFFEDKEDLFGAIVEEPLEGLILMLKRHFAEDETELSEPLIYEHSAGDHDEMTALLIRHLYKNYDAFMLLLTGSQGSRYEDCVDRIVDMTDQAYIAIAGKMAEGLNGKKVNHYMSHWLTHMSIDAFIHLLTHEKDERRAMKNMKIIMDYIVKGWMDMIFIGD